MNTPFVAFGDHSLTAVQLCSAVVAEFGKRPDLLFLTSADFTVRELLKSLNEAGQTRMLVATRTMVVACACRLLVSLGWRC